MRRYVKRFRFQRQHVAVFCLIVLFVTLILAINLSLYPIIYDVSAQIGKQNISSIINETVTDVLSSDAYSYSSFVSYRYSSSGFVSSVEYDYKTINILKLETEKLLIDKLSRLGNTKIKIPLGSLLGELTSSGYGPYIRLRISQAAVSKIDVVSTFESVGINQSRHEIRLVISTYAQFYLPPSKNDFSLTQEYVLAQTIIVGDIPQGIATLG